MSMITFRIGGDVKKRLDAVSEQLGLNQGKVRWDAVLERLEELEEVALVVERVKANRPKKPINDLWKELGLDV